MNQPYEDDRNKKYIEARNKLLEAMNDIEQLLPCERERLIQEMMQIKAINDYLKNNYGMR